MKLTQLFDSKIDQNDVESQYVWNLKREAVSQELLRVNLSTLKKNPFFANSSSLSRIFLTHYIALPNNQIFGRFISRVGNKSHLFIADENSNLKIIETSPWDRDDTSCFSCCFYDDSIYTFRINECPKRYMMSQKRWVSLPNARPIGKLCIGFKEKIILRDSDSSIWLYDIIIDSYSHHTLLKKHNEKIIVKHDGKVYLIDINYFGSIQYFVDPLSDWHLIHISCANNYYSMDYFHMYFKRSIYYFRDRNLYEFSLNTFQEKAIKLI